MKDFKAFYRELGNLFYAIANADDQIQPEEKQKMEDQIRFNWKHLEPTQDEYGTDASYIILFEFDTAQESGMPAEKAFNSFVYFFRENEKEINEGLRKRIFNSCRQIAETFRKINTKELEMLEKIRNIFQLNGQQ